MQVAHGTVCGAYPGPWTPFLCPKETGRGCPLSTWAGRYSCQSHPRGGPCCCLPPSPHPTYYCQVWPGAPCLEPVVVNGNQEFSRLA